MKQLIENRYIGAIFPIDKVTLSAGESIAFSFMH